MKNLPELKDLENASDAEAVRHIVLPTMKTIQRQWEQGAGSLF